MRMRPTGPSATSAVRHDMVTADGAFWRGAYEAHAAEILGFLRRRLKSGPEAEDLLQEVFVRAIRAETFRRDQPPRPYLFSIARNLVASKFRKPGLTLVTSRDDSDAEPLDHVAAGDADPQERAQWSDFTRAFAEALEQLGADHRQAFELGVLQQLPYAEIAELQGWSLSQVKVNVHRARRKLIAALDDHIPASSGISRSRSETARAKARAALEGTR